MMKISVKNIRCNPVIGVYDSEKLGPQPILINLKIDFDPGKASDTDSIHDTLDYCEMTRNLVKQVDSTRYELLESLVHYVADFVLEQPQAQRVEVEIDKPEALKDWADSVSLTLVKTH